MAVSGFLPLTAISYLNHSNIIKYCNRPFMSDLEKGLAERVNNRSVPATEFRISRESTNLMTDTIIDSINASVAPDDNLVIAGDFCWTSRDSRFADAKRLRDRIKCKNLILIVGNHDDPRILSPLFNAVYDQYSFNIDGQSIFINHYPMRSWDKAHHGAWALGGHVHGLYGPEDSGELMPYDKHVFSEGFQSVLNRHNIQDKNKIIEELLAVTASVKGIDLTLDIGVDNTIRNVPFGTPWSMDDLRDYFGKKKNKWLGRQEAYRQLSQASTVKSNPKI